MWHASISLLSDGGAVPFMAARWNRKLKMTVLKRLGRMLNGCGRAPDKIWMGPLSLQLRRSLSDAEIGRLDPAWLALPAIDMGSPGEELES